ncbi:uncharacterized protein HMPREF1541_10584 [Cyphellophora europaea CBS 101466]|uniref:Methyltransferase type 11 domain-containing protein n=1 Tax=Cyphellophora europaea (strain CBS 101466) TaxID=1220924 RepID=W2S934_CYPE1|nr:uncharacterized protein HMPREF1541_10584 [Cyphellophora europaea CBS 101466]ETN44404.1 hypothetical protein HMPREF1541_10584 [Cyphellophora europaea CBS 101466]
MAQATTSSRAPAPTEKTFTKYTPDQASTYTQFRRNYHPSVYNFIITSHTTTGGQLDTVLDVGCGPGLATRTLATHFQHALGLDPSPGMIDTARTLGGTTLSGSPIQYTVSSAEALNSIPAASIDLLTVANAAHWFSSMPHFWARAAEVVRPNGTVALWTGSHFRALPDLPNAEKIQAVMEAHVDDENLEPYMEEGNRMVRGGYASLPLPWHCGVPAFDEKDFVRQQWPVTEPFYEGQAEGSGVDLKTAEKMMGTGSAITRWREANPELAGTEADPVCKLVADIGRLLREAGVKEGEERVNGGVEGVVLLVKRRGE